MVEGRAKRKYYHAILPDFDVIDSGSFNSSPGPDANVVPYLRNEAFPRHVSYDGLKRTADRSGRKRCHRGSVYFGAATFGRPAAIRPLFSVHCPPFCVVLDDMAASKIRLKDRADAHSLPA